MQITRPTRDLNRLLFLETARKHISTCLEQEPNTPYACLAERFNVIPKKFDTAMQTARQATGMWRKTAAKRQEAANRLSRCCRDFYIALERRTEREGHGAHVLAYFKMQSDSSLPKAQKVGSWVLIARDLIEGDQLAIAEGHPPMVNPSCEDLQKHLDVIEEANQAVDATHTAQQEAQKALIALRDESDLLFRRLYHLLVGWLLAETPSRRRNAMRKFGYVFRTNNASSDVAEANIAPDATEIDGDEPILPETVASEAVTTPTSEEEITSEEAPPLQISRASETKAPDNPGAFVIATQSNRSWTSRTGLPSKNSLPTKSGQNTFLSRHLHLAVKDISGEHARVRFTER